jgi:hypothetical protein
MLRRKARSAQEDSQARSGGANQIEAAHRFATDRLMNT